MNILSLIIIFSVISSLPALISAFLFKRVSFKWFRKNSGFFLSFAAGVILSVVFLDIIPEILQEIKNPQIFGFLFLLGILFFYLLEQSYWWYHHHEEKIEEEVVHPQAYLILIGDAFHNFMDGLIIAAAFLVDVKLGVLVSLSVIFHELPQEIGDFIVLISSGVRWFKAMIFNFATAITNLLGAVLGFFFISKLEDASIFILSISAGGFLYIASSDIIPELHKEKNIKKSFLEFLILLLGIALIFFVGKIFA